MSDEPVFIAARDRRAAEEVARSLELRPQEWRFLTDAYALRGRPNLRVAFGYRHFEHPAAVEVESTLAIIERHRPGTVEYIKVPAR